MLTFAMSVSMFNWVLAEDNDSAPISTVDGFLDVEVENMPYDPIFFKPAEKDLYSGGMALSLGSWV